MSQCWVQQQVPDTLDQGAVFCPSVRLFAKPIYPLKTDWMSLLYCRSASLLLLTWALAASWMLNVVWHHDPSYTKWQLSIAKQEKSWESNPIFSNLGIPYADMVGNHIRSETHLANWRKSSKIGFIILFENPHNLIKKWNWIYSS